MKLSDVSVTSYHIHSNINYEKLLFEICMHEMFADVNFYLQKFNFYLLCKNQKKNPQKMGNIFHQKRLVVVCYHHVDGRCFRSGLEIYQDKNAPINERVADLMKK